MIYTVRSSYIDVLDTKINKLRKHYAVEVLGFCVSGVNAYAMLDVTEMNTWDPDLGEEPRDLPEDPADFDALILS